MSQTTGSTAGPVPVSPCDFVVFGGTGDLAVRKLLPALYLRHRDGQLPAETRIVAVSRAGLDDAGYRDKIRGELPRFVRTDELDGAVLDRFIARLTHVSIDIEQEAGWTSLVETLDEPDRVEVTEGVVAERVRTGHGPDGNNLARAGRLRTGRTGKRSPRPRRAAP